jgi:hypothetical protein
MKTPAALKPAIFWHSDPVGPDETVMIQGDGFADDALVELGVISDEAEAGNFEPQKWRQIQPAQRSAQCLKAVIPEEWKPGLYACRVRQGGVLSNQVMLNAPDVWWFQGDEGRAAARRGGWLRVFGKCLQVGGASQILLVSREEKKISLALHISTTYSLAAALPENLSAGAYTVMIHNGSGGATGWKAVGNLSIHEAKSAPSTVVSALDFGAVPDGKKDCTFAIVQGLEQLAALGGGVLYFPPGRYRIDSILRSGMWINHPLKIPPGVVLRGAGADLVSLWWPDQKEPLPTLIEGSHDFGVEDLSIYTQGRHRNIISGESNARIRRVRIRANCYYMMMHDGRAHHGRGAPGEINQVGTALEFQGSNIEITDCDIYTSGAGFALKHVKGGWIARNSVRGMNFVFISGGREIIFEENVFEGNSLTSMGSNIALHFGAASCRHVYYGHNRAHHMHGGDHEALTLDGHGTAYLGRLAEVEETRVVLATDPLLGVDGTTDNMRTLNDATIYVLSGRGAGQYRSIVSFEGRKLELDRPWLVPPDATSHVSVGTFNGRHLIIGNTAEDTGTVTQLYPPNCECIVAENRGLHASGMSSLSKLGINDKERFYRVEVSWFNQFLDNHVVWGNGWGGGETEVDRWIGGEGYLNIWGWQVSFFNDAEGHDQDRLLTPEALAQLLGEPVETVKNIPLSRGQIIRRHKIDNNSSIRIRGAVVDVLVEKSIIRHAQNGIRVDNEPKREHRPHIDMLYFEPEQPPPPPGQKPPFLSPHGILLRKNEMKGVKIPYSGTALEQTQID